MALILPRKLQLWIKSFPISPGKRMLLEPQATLLLMVDCVVAVHGKVEPRVHLWIRISIQPGRTIPILILSTNLPA